MNFTTNSHIAMLEAQRGARNHNIGIPVPARARARDPMRQAFRNRPVAEGAVIQRAQQNVLENNTPRPTRLGCILSCVRMMVSFPYRAAQLFTRPTAIQQHAPLVELDPVDDVVPVDDDLREIAHLFGDMVRTDDFGRILRD